MNRILNIVRLFMVMTLAFSCAEVTSEDLKTSCAYAGYFDVLDVPADDSTSVKAVVTISPYNGVRDTLLVETTVSNIVCMSSSQVAGLASIGADSVISAVSGLKYITNPGLRDRGVHDIGYESSLDYERILNLAPDILLTYTVSGAEPQYISRLRSLGVRVLVLHDHLEEHPLARAEYIRLYGALTGRQEIADSLFKAICERYMTLADEASSSGSRVKVLMNVPYADAWYVPGGDSYMARLVNDAGGEVLGALPETSSSRIISLEEAYGLSQEADMWLNPGACRTRDGLASFHHTFPLFGPLAKDCPIYNNTLRMTPEGGNDFWESGSVCPDLVLQDLITIFSSVLQGGTPEEDALKYHFEVK